MTLRGAPRTGIDRRAAFRAERADVLAFCESLGPADWRMNSRAEGWSITDVVAHLGSSCHAMFTPSAVRLMRNDDIEGVNDLMVAVRRERTPTQVFGEYRRWSRTFQAVIPGLVRTPLARFPVQLGELGSFPLSLLSSAAVFDHHTHLRFDMAPALGRPAPGTDENRMAVVLEWMMAVLSNQLRAAKPVWLDRALSIMLTGPGGGTWRIGTSGTVIPDQNETAGCRITSAAVDFPAWGTRRANWRERDIRIDGDTDYAATFLDWMNIV